MPEILRFVGPNKSAELFGVQLIGVNAETGAKLLITLVFVMLVVLVSRLAQRLVNRRKVPVRELSAFWVRQGIRLVAAVVLGLGVMSVWFDQPARLATAFGLMGAGIAFALQRVITAFAGYFIILRGDVFNVGDRITMGGVRGDVIGLTFMQTKIMEMGQPPSVQNADPAVWVKSRQYTGRIVSVNNTQIFDEPVYNYTRDFPYIWEEMMLPIPFNADRERAEQILLEAARHHSLKAIELGAEALAELRRRYAAAPAEVEPRVYWRLTENWLELSVRFLCTDHGVRDVKDAMSRAILEKMDAAGIQIASASLVISKLPTLSIAAIHGADFSNAQFSGPISPARTSVPASGTAPT